MKRTLLLSLALLAAGSTLAVAADLPAPAPQSYYKAPPPPAPTWTGCYINGGGGGGLMTTNQHGEVFATLAPTTQAIDTGGQGWLAGGGAGCDYQFHLLNWDVVIGAFGDYDWMNLRGTSSFPGFLAVGDVKETSAWAGGARAGVLAAPWVLVYGTGGYTGTHLNSVNLTSAFTGAPSGVSLPSQNLNGWFIGGGTEAELRWVMPGLFLRTEYRYSSYQSTDTQFVVTATGAPSPFGVHANMYTQTIFTELVWRFNFNGAHW